jgi:preprotein translocase subunit SecY
VATSANQLAKSGKFGDLRRRIVFLLLALVVYRIGAHIPVPGIDPVQLQQLFQGQAGGILNLFNMFSGGALVALHGLRAGDHAVHLGVDHHAADDLRRADARGPEEGRRGRPAPITQYTRYGTLVLAIFQSLGIALALEGSPGLVLVPGFGFRMTAVVSLVAGTMFLMWLGEQITERGLGNGISILIFRRHRGWACRAPSAGCSSWCAPGP